MSLNNFKGVPCIRFKISFYILENKKQICVYLPRYNGRESKLVIVFIVIKIGTKVYNYFYYIIDENKAFI